MTGAKHSSITEPEAEVQRARYGFNEIKASEKELFVARVAKVLREPMLILLILTAGLYLSIGDITEGLILLSSVLFVIGITLYQDIKSENALAALRELASPRALVIRDGVEKRVPARDLVPGDLIVLQEGARIPADGVILEASHLVIDESLLTGESFPVTKCAIQNDFLADAFGSIENKNKVFLGTLALGGSALVRIINTGAETEIGNIGKNIKEEPANPTNLSKEIRKIVRVVASIGAIISVLIILLYGFFRNDWIQGLLVGLATEMALLPEEFPVVLTIFLALGAWRLSKSNVLVREPQAIEKLGAITTLCVDKTGTLTENRMAIAETQNFKSNRNIIELAALASRPNPFDPMEKAIYKKQQPIQDFELVKEYPFSDHLLAMTNVWKNKITNEFQIACKGAPETVIKLCKLNQTDADEINKTVSMMGQRGLRVLGVAEGSIRDIELPSEQNNINFIWVGLLGFEDPIRREVPDAVKVCTRAGIRVIMMTGDFPETAKSIGTQAGISSNQILTGAAVKSLSDKDLKNMIGSVNIFARMVPDQKLRIVKALKETGQIVAMTGDGINDAPSLKWADVGIAMGERGTDVAREASDLVLLDDNFASIVSGIERGRRIYDNIIKALSYIVSVHVPIAGLAFLPVLFNWPPIFFPAHIVFLELIIDPTSSLLFESHNVKGNIMDRPPRAAGIKLFNRSAVTKSLLQGFLVLILSSLVYVATLYKGETYARTVTFLFTVLSNLGVIIATLNLHSISDFLDLVKKPITFAILIGTPILLILGVQIESAANLFHFTPLKIVDYSIIFLGSVILWTILIAWNAVRFHSRGVTYV